MTGAQNGKPGKYVACKVSKAVHRSCCRVCLLLQGKCKARAKQGKARQVVPGRMGVMLVPVVFWLRTTLSGVCARKIMPSFHDASICSIAEWVALAFIVSRVNVFLYPPSCAGHFIFARLFFFGSCFKVMTRMSGESSGR